MLLINWGKEKLAKNAILFLICFGCMCFRSVLVVLGIAPDSETSSQAQTTGVALDSQNSSQAQISEAHTGHTSNSDNVVTEKSKESSGAT